MVPPKRNHDMPADHFPATTNPAWGFHGTISGHADTESAWPLAMAAVTAATGCAPDDVRAFLDSGQGRHFADDVLNTLIGQQTLPGAISAVTGRWMGWTIGRATSREQGIPHGLPYLTGFIMHAAIEADTTG